MAAKTNGTVSNDLLPQNLPPYQPGKAYTLKSLEGEIIYIPCSKSAMRLLVTGKETEGAFALVGTGGSQGGPIGFHFHREAHDVFLTLKGSINVWCNDQCRTMGPGDFASVPPNAIHQYQILGDYTEFVGLIVPGGWEEFFRFIGEPYAGPMWPLTDERNIFEVLIPKLKAAAEKFDMVPQPQYQGGEPRPFDGSENVLPGKLEPYYLQANKGPKYLVDGVVVKPLATTKESAGRFSIGSIEGSSKHDNPVLKNTFQFAEVHHAVQPVEGQLEIVIDRASTTLNAFETAYIPKGSSFSIKFASRFAQAYIFASGGGLLETLSDVGETYQHSMIPEKEAVGASEKLSQVSAKHGCQLS